MTRRADISRAVGDHVEELETLVAAGSDEYAIWKALLNALDWLYRYNELLRRTDPAFFAKCHAYPDEPTATRCVFVPGLHLLGVSAPERM